jgi:hypothetical protein
MKKLLITLALIFGLCFPAYATMFGLEAESEVQLNKEMVLNIAGEEVSVDMSSQAYMLALPLTMGNLVLTPKVGGFVSKFETDLIDTDNSLGIISGLDAEYMLL